MRKPFGLRSPAIIDGDLFDEVALKLITKKINKV